MNRTATFRSGEQCVTRLRDLATGYALTLRQIAAGERKGSRRATEDKLIGICTAIEVLTENGNYYFEMNDAVKRAGETSK